MTLSNRWTPRNIYLYVVCLVTLIIMLFAVANGVRSLVEFLYPEPSTYYAAVVGEDTPDPEQLQQQEAFQRQWSQRQAILSLAGNGALLLLAAPLYAYHWRKIERKATD